MSARESPSGGLASTWFSIITASGLLFCHSSSRFLVKRAPFNGQGRSLLPSSYPEVTSVRFPKGVTMFRGLFKTELNIMYESPADAKYRIRAPTITSSIFFLINLIYSRVRLGGQLFLLPLFPPLKMDGSLVLHLILVLHKRVFPFLNVEMK